MLEKILSEVATGVATLVVAAVGYYGGKLLKGLANEAQKRIITRAAWELVRWAAQTMSNPGPEKFQAVAEKLHKRFAFLDAEALEVAIEAAYRELKDTTTGVKP